MPQNIKNLLIQKLSSIDNVKFAYLFGSYARNTQKDSSDVDIALYLKHSGFDIELELNYELSKYIKKDVDLVILNSTRNLFLIESILKEGVVLKDNKKRAYFELKKEHEILDYKEFKRAINVA